MKTITRILLAALLGCVSLQAAGQLPVNKTVGAGVPFTIRSDRNATPGSSYHWLRNGELLPGATAASHTGAISTAGTYMFIRIARHNGLCGEWLSSNPYVLEVACGATLASGNASQRVCEGKPLVPVRYATTGVTNATHTKVSGLPQGVHHSWANDTLTLAGTPVAAGIYPYTLSVCGSPVGAGTLTVDAPPAITLVSGQNNDQTTRQNTAITDIVYTTAHATGAVLTAGGFPTGIAGTGGNKVYTISGRPMDVGKFSYTLTTTNAGHCDNNSVSGTLTVTPAITYTNCHPATFTISAAKASFTSSATYNINGLIVSSMVRMDSCAKASFKGKHNNTLYIADCRSNTHDSLGHLFSWCMATMYVDQLCPPPWRLPSKEDFCKIAGFPLSQCNNKWDVTQEVNENGWLPGGYCENTGLRHAQGVNGYYWSSTQIDDKNGREAEARDGYFDPDGDGFNEKYYGQSIRCVREP